jgi:beta-1,2-mannobiose phosphorylase / 1,2-beta-oligomannan phosphorylase
MRTSPADLFTRHPANPVLTAAQWPYPINSVFNPAATVVNGDTVLLCRVEDRRGISHLTVARSPDGLTDWRIDEEPLIADDPDDRSSMWGVEDARVTRLPDLDAWLIAYTAYGPDGPCVALASTDDFKAVQRLGIAVPPEDKNACLFPRRVDGQYLLFHRPVSVTAGRAGAWLSRSTDLRSWTTPEPVLAPRAGAWWDALRVGVGPPPIETEAGWLVIYHGVKQMVTGPIYRVGLALLDRDTPRHVLRRSNEWVFAPAAPYELVGDAPGVVFPTGLVHDRESDEVRIYYGAADTCIAVATAPLSELVAHLR